MKCFNRAIIYDQRRKLLVPSILLTIILVYQTFNVYEVMSINYVYMKSITFMEPGGIKASRLIVIGLIVAITVVSIGFKEKSERISISSMPLKRKDITLTKFLCSNLALMIPLLTNFVAETIIYLINKNFLVSNGYYYGNVIVINIVSMLSALLIVGGIFLVSSFYNNVKITIFISLGGLLSAWVIVTSIPFFLFKDDTGLQIIKEKVDYIVSCSRATLDLYADNILAIIIFMVGIVVLIYSLVIYITEFSARYNHSSIYSLGISKIITHIIIIMSIIAILVNIFEFTYGLLYFDQAMMNIPEDGEYEKLNSMRAKIFLIFLIISTIISIFIGGRGIKRLEEKFQ